MSYPSVDALQKTLAETVFVHTSDKKKAAGRALGTIVEIITYYLLRTWGFRNSIAIERRLGEYNNKSITHNVEYSLHPSIDSAAVTLRRPELPLSVSKLRRHLPSHTFGFPLETFKKSIQLLASDRRLRNSCTLAEHPELGILMANLESFDPSSASVEINVLHHQPWAVFECKRVGVEEGMKKGPQTIEKAKQGAYVARTISSLQKIRLADGRLGGLIHTREGRPLIGEHSELMGRLIESESSDVLRQFILSVGVVSNHGNWFTGDDRNKELEVLAASYDWLVFLTDEGLTEFIQEFLLEPVADLKPAQQAFLSSYHSSRKTKTNRFTKVRMDLNADEAIQRYFLREADRVEAWFRVISPAANDLEALKVQLSNLRAKDWHVIHGIS